MSPQDPSLAPAGALTVTATGYISPADVGFDTAVLVLLLSVVVVVVGGLGSIPGALIAAIGVGEAQTLGISALPDWVAPYLLSGAAITALVVRVRLAPRWRRTPRRVAVGGGAA